MDVYESRALFFAFLLTRRAACAFCLGWPRGNDAVDQDVSHGF
jgi:hypothetical protein